MKQVFYDLSANFSPLKSAPINKPAMGWENTCAGSKTATAVYKRKVHKGAVLQS